MRSQSGAGSNHFNHHCSNGVCVIHFVRESDAAPVHAIAALQAQVKS
jgi:hypothetical protein